MIAITKTNLEELETGLQISIISSKYFNLAHVFLGDAANTLPEHVDYDLCLKTTGTPLFKSLYNFSQNKLGFLQEYITNNLAKRFIQPSTSSSKVLILFVKKKDVKLRLCVNYRGLNLITKKNHYPLSLILKALDQMVGAKIFTKLDIQAAYNQI